VLLSGSVSVDDLPADETLISARTRERQDRQRFREVAVPTAESEQSEPSRAPEPTHA